MPTTIVKSAFASVEDCDVTVCCVELVTAKADSFPGCIPPAEQAKNVAVYSVRMGLSKLDNGLRHRGLWGEYPFLTTANGLLCIRDGYLH